MKTRTAINSRHDCTVTMVLLIVLTTFFLIPSAEAQYSESASKILNHYVRVTGGEEAYEKIENRVTESQLTVEGSDIQMNIRVITQKPNLVRMITESAATGKVVSGCNGETVWELSAVKGPVIKNGKEKENALHLNTMDRLAHWREVFRKAEFKGVKNINRQSCFTVYVEPYEADPQLLYFDRGTKLLVALETNMKSEMGNLPIISYFDDYREVDGVLLPFEKTVHIGSQVMISRVKNIKHNVDLEEDLFALPEEIRNLAEKEG